MKRLLLLLLTGFTFLILPACGDDKSQGDLFKEEGPIPQVEPHPYQAPQDKFNLFTDNPNPPSRPPSEFVPDDKSGINEGMPATDDTDEDIRPPAEDSPHQEDNATEPPEHSQPRPRLNRRDVPPKVQSRRNENLDDIPPEDESSEMQNSPPDENTGEEETPPEKNDFNREPPDNRPERPDF